MLAFFATIGLSADFASLKKGGRVVGIFLLAVTGLLILQNAMGIGLATMLGLDPLMGLLTGSITLAGGHGTGQVTDVRVHAAVDYRDRDALARGVHPRRRHVEHVEHPLLAVPDLVGRGRERGRGREERQRGSRARHAGGERQPETAPG